MHHHWREMDGGNKKITKTSPDRLLQNTEQYMTSRKWNCHTVCRLFPAPLQTRFKSGLPKPFSSSTMETLKFFFMGNSWAEVKGKTMVVGDKGSYSLLLNVWLQILHLHLGQITQCGLPTTSVCMTNHCDRASFQPTQLNTYACEQTKTHSYGYKEHALLWSPTQCLRHFTHSYNYMTTKNKATSIS